MSDETMDILIEVVNQACYMKETIDGKEIECLDSCALSSYADALRYLESKGKVKIISQYGRRIIATWV